MGRNLHGISILKDSARIHPEAPKMRNKQIGDTMRALLTLLLFLVLLPVLESGCGLTSGAGKGTVSQLSNVSITTSSLPATQPQTSYKASLAASGGKTPYLWSIASGTLPPGLSLTGATGTIAGKATVAGNYAFTIEVQDSASPTGSASQALGIDVATPGSALKISTVNLPGGQVGVTYSTAVIATGGTAPYTWSISSGALPVGLALSSATGGIAGTPTQTGQSSFTVSHLGQYRLVRTTIPQHSNRRDPTSVVVANQYHFFAWRSRGSRLLGGSSSIGWYAGI